MRKFFLCLNIYFEQTLSQIELSISIDSNLNQRNVSRKSHRHYSYVDIPNFLEFFLFCKDKWMDSLQKINILFHGVLHSVKFYTIILLSRLSLTFFFCTFLSCSLSTSLWGNTQEQQTCPCRPSVYCRLAEIYAALR